MQNVTSTTTSTTTSPKHPVEQGVTSMRSIFRDGITTHEAIRVPLDVAEDVLGCGYDGSFGHDQVLRVTLATDPASPKPPARTRPNRSRSGSRSKS